MQELALLLPLTAGMCNVCGYHNREKPLIITIRGFFVF